MTQLDEMLITYALYYAVHHFYLTDVLAVQTEPNTCGLSPGENILVWCRQKSYYKAAVITRFKNFHAFSGPGLQEQLPF